MAINRAIKRPAASFSRSACTGCLWAQRCLPKKTSRRIQIHPNEGLFQHMAAELATPEGRALRRERTYVEHAMARLGAVQSRRARFRGLEKNQFHTEVCAVVVNCFVIGRLLAA